jgi:hypothetical protein
MVAFVASFTTFSLSFFVPASASFLICLRSATETYLIACAGLLELWLIDVLVERL